MSPDSAAQEGKHASFLSSEALLAAIVDSSDDAIVSKNLSSIVTSWNKGAQRIFGYTADEMVGQSITKILPPERLGEETTIIARLKNGERIEHFETERVRKDGRRIHVSLTISPVCDRSGKIVGASKIARDITEQKQAAARLAEAHEQLKRADRMKAEFISTLSHELRTPLTAMLGWVQLLKDGTDPDDVAQGLEIIERNARALMQLVSDLLDMSRIEAGKMSLDLQRTDLPAVVNAAVEGVRATATLKGLRLTTAFSSINGLVMADRNRLQQILWNLLNNAIKFTPKHGRIHVTLRRVNSHVELGISDTGIGIEPGFIDCIFERFSQADSSITRRHGGLGLGLAIVKHLVELHGGSIRVRSDGPGTGACFTVDLPLLPAHDAVERMDGMPATTGTDGAAMDGTDNLHGVKVLVVDDDPDSATTVQKILRRRGADVRGAGSMDEALAVFTEFQPHLLLSDIGMPIHDGYELIARVRALPGGRRVPAVALTALARAEDRTLALRAGFQMHVAKPVEATELVALVRNLADLNRA